MFSSAIYLGQMVGVAAAALVYDHFTAAPLFLATAVILPILGWWYARELRRHAKG
jgi:predicted MFS family arabinose efflux permease